MNRKKILIVEDDTAIRQGISEVLGIQGYDVSEAADGLIGMEKALQTPAELILLDLALPGRDGLEILQEVRRVKPTLPVIILTARGDEEDRVKGLRLGADDYVVKPFSAKELVARVEAVLRRSPERPAAVSRVEIPGGHVDFERCEVVHGEERAELSEKERQLLEYLATNPGRAISREEILTRVWQINADHLETRTIDMHVARLREKLRDNSGKPAILLTVRGKGYMFTAGAGQ